ncbi:MAG: hypothetical protein A2086_09175 [Spirochaetes bacterium GWD1_27_9]|nr:MAG: hypothetical protein A2Z98_12990 [Spirochaetes bacterium GWB1_27_13]OHD20419.1 MAG: hypothetical protein A2Y34_10560 [Spirochaetes bacterium GWC1_27_15]OHD31983.1 MAG: hypothetical protein A2086_09175 [Spirochaetes bacterium GWD1_27_9]
MKRNLILIILIFIVSTFIFSNTNGKQIQKNSKFIEFAIGGNFNHYFNFKYSNQETSYKFNSSFYDYEISYFDNLTNFQFAQLFSTSLVSELNYYINKKFSLGITASLGYGTTLNYGLVFSIINNLIGNFKINTKFGNLQKNMLVLEYGISLIGQYNVNYNLDYDLESLLTTFRYGPNLLIGYELKTKKNFKFLIGGTFEANFDYGKETFWNEGYTKIFFADFLWGIEFRWSFYSINQLK